MTITRAERFRTLGLVAFALIAVAILVLSLWPRAPNPDPDGKDKFRHFAAYACLIFPVAVTARPALFRALACAVFLGFAIEMLQPLSGRTREFADMAANVAGLGVGVAAGLSLHALRRVFRP